MVRALFITLDFHCSCQLAFAFVSTSMIVNVIIWI